MPPNRFESEVESFLEGSHGDRTHIKRADHHTVTPLCGTLLNPEALRTWVRAVEQGGRNERGEISDQEAHIRALEAENRELRRANEILKAASAFFGAEPGRLGR